MPFTYGQTVTLRRRSVSGQDGYGNDTYAFVEENISPCAVQPGGSGEELQFADRLTSDITVFLPPGTDISYVDAIVVDESITASIDLGRTLSFERPGDYFGARGGGIGQALPGALGVKLAHPRRPVVAVSGDGSAMYSIQALWTAAHHDLAVVFVILNNREYRILKHNMDTYRQRFGAKPERGYPNMDLVAPDLGFVDLARGMGVEGLRVTQPGELRPAFDKALGAGRPFLLDVAIEGRP